ncbi:hypothetical protein GG344DRAFT_60204 [Lentinula edodes]|nr:hypothetical protein GG344DRAFT_60204 [Lentinula edodes]
MMSARTAPPSKTICFHRGGSSILILNFCGKGPKGFNFSFELSRRKHTFNLDGSPFRTRVRYNCFISFSRRLGRPAYMLDPPERMTCLYSSARHKHCKSESRPATPGCSTSTRCGWNIHSGALNRSEPTLIVHPSGN